MSIKLYSDQYLVPCLVKPIVIIGICRCVALARERPRLPLEGKLSASRLTDEVCRNIARFAGASGEFAALFHLIRHGFAVTPSPQGEGFWGAPSPVHHIVKSQLPKQFKRLQDVSWRRLSYRIKFVLWPFSAFGASIPACFPASMHWSSQAMFLPRFRMVWRPSSS